MTAQIVASDWRAIEPPRNTLQGFLTLRLSSGLVLRECSYHRQGERRWIGLPGKPVLDQDGRQRTDPETGKRLFTAIVDFSDSKRRAEFQRQALAAVDRLLGEAPPDPVGGRL